MNDNRFYAFSCFKSKKSEDGFYVGLIYRADGASMCTLDNKGFTKVASGAVFYQIKEALEKGAFLVEVEAVPVSTQYGLQFQVTGFVGEVEID
ncbi:MAG: hypothetical protein J6S67_18185 [Methanobrevibacter sp.]|nr:hypothetical protein [Methanobrevibacter sp.]